MTPTIRGAPDDARGAPGLDWAADESYADRARSRRDRYVAATAASASRILCAARPGLRRTSRRSSDRYFSGPARKVQRLPRGRTPTMATSSRGSGHPANCGTYVRRGRGRTTVTRLTRRDTTMPTLTPQKTIRTMAPRPRRRSGLIVVMAVLGLAVSAPQALSAIAPCSAALYCRRFRRSSRPTMVRTRSCRSSEAQPKQFKPNQRRPARAPAKIWFRVKSSRSTWSRPTQRPRVFRPFRLRRRRVAAQSRLTPSASPWPSMPPTAQSWSSRLGLRRRRWPRAAPTAGPAATAGSLLARAEEGSHRHHPAPTSRRRGCDRRARPRLRLRRRASRRAARARRPPNRAPASSSAAGRRQRAAVDRSRCRGRCAAPAPLREHAPLRRGR